MLAHVEELEGDIQAVSKRIEEEIRPFALLATILGVDRRAAEVIIAEPLPDRGAPRLLGRSLPRAERIRRQAQVGQDPEGLQVAAP